MDRGIVSEDGAGAVTVVDVEVDHQNRFLESLRPQPRDGHRDIVKDAESRPAVTGGVVIAAAKVDGHRAPLEGEPGGHDRAADRRALHADDLLNLGVADFLAEDPFGHLGVMADGIEVIRVVNPEQAAQRRRSRHRDIVPIEQTLIDQESEDLPPAHRVEGDALDGPRVGVREDEANLRHAPPPPHPTPPPPHEAAEAGDRIGPVVHPHVNHPARRHGRSIGRYT